MILDKVKLLTCEEGEQYSFRFFESPSNVNF